MSNSFELSKQKDLLGGRGQASFEVSAPSNVEVAAALATDTPFPNRAIDLLDVELKATAGRKLTFKGVGTKMGAELGVGGRVLVRQRADQLEEELGLDAPLAPGLDLPSDVQAFLLLERSYTASAKADGSVALGATAGKVSFSAGAATGRRLAVVKAVPSGMGARTALGEAVGDWRPPRSVVGPGGVALEPGTWLVTETEGSIEVGVKAELGFDYSWIRNSPLGTLEGDIGLRVAGGLEATFGLSASGRFAVVVGRPGSDNKVRVRLQRIRQRSLAAGFDGRIGAKAKLPTNLPDTPTGLARAIMGTQTLQLLDDIQAVQDLAEGTEDAAELVAGFTAGAARDLLDQTFGGDAQARLDEAKQKVGELMAKIDEAEEAAVAFLVNNIQKRIDAADATVDAFVGDLREGLGRLQDPTRVRSEVAELVGNVDALDGPVGRWLSDVIGDRVVTLLANNDLSEIISQAGSTLAVLDVNDLGGEALLAKLTGAIRGQFAKLDRLTTKLDKPLDFDVDDLEVWAKDKLQQFLGTTATAQALEDIRGAFGKLFGKTDAIYAALIEAAKKKYEAQLAVSIQRTTSRTALLDATFDLDEGQSVEDLFQKVLEGELADVLLESHPGVTLHAGTLSHGMSRRMNVELTLPWMDKSVSKVTDALASLSTVEEDDGRIHIMDVQATNTVTVATEQQSALSLSAAVQMGSGVRSFSPERFELTSSFRRATDDLHEVELEQWLEQWAGLLFPGVFDSGQGTVQDWVRELDDLVDTLEPDTGARYFGDTLLKVTTSLPASVGEAWFRAPADRNDPLYETFGRGLQEALKNVLAAVYFANPDLKRYDLARSTHVLVYASLPGHMRKRGHWFPEDLGLMLAHPRTELNLRERLRLVKAAVSQRSDFASNRAHHYSPDNAARFLNDVAAVRHQELQLERLLRFEKKVVNKALDAAVNVGKARQAYDDARAGSTDRDKKLAEALEHMSSFGAKITEAFNEHMDPSYMGGMARPLGTYLFAKASSLLSGGAEVSPVSRLEISVVKNDTFDLASYLQGTEPPAADVLIKQRVLSL